ncbi:hypothetical protein T01_15232 [Trichinella spiralis]|uniref:Uncharacterized protein n=1 Tax=Trichinella spiralis TaxID=6334 RepID=A0A0V1BR97_TRISP|nr:hypothetical protein T01_15232 [Trichinella spiralis]
MNHQLNNWLKQNSNSSACNRHNEDNRADWMFARCYAKLPLHSSAVNYSVICYDLNYYLQIITTDNYGKHYGV